MGIRGLKTRGWERENPTAGLLSSLQILTAAGLSKPHLSTATYDMPSSHSQNHPCQVKQQESNNAGDQTNPELYQHFAKLVSSFPNSKGMLESRLYRHEQGWHAYMPAMVGAMVADACFAARPTDIIVATSPKSGTTWIKALLYSTVRRAEHRPATADADAADDRHPLHSLTPHLCIKFLEYQLYTNNRIPDLDKLPDPRMFATHLPFAALPRTITAAGCKVVYLCRDPKDTLVSLWDFLNKFRARDGLDPLTAERAAELFCDGSSPFGPYWDHVLGYWRAHLADPERVLFLRYEEMQRDPAAHVRRLAEFAGVPVSGAEEEDGVVDAIVKLCSFERMIGLEANRGRTTMETALGELETSWFFRRGVVGDWANRLTPEVARRIDAVTEDRFEGSGLDVV